MRRLWTIRLCVLLVACGKRESRNESNSSAQGPNPPSPNKTAAR